MVGFEYLYIRLFKGWFKVLSRLNTYDWTKILKHNFSALETAHVTQNASDEQRIITVDSLSLEAEEKVRSMNRNDSRIFHNSRLDNLLTENAKLSEQVAIQADQVTINKFLVFDPR